MITLSAVSAAHGLRVLFQDVTLQIVPGRRIGLVGPNGAGKTTLLEMIAGDRPVTDGEISRAKDARVGYLRQDVAETRGRTVLDEVLAAAGDVKGLERRLRELEAAIADDATGDDRLLAAYGDAQDRFERLGGYEIESRARKVLAGLGFAQDQMERDVGTFSGGWMMRIALARLLLSAPDVLLLDEPTNHLDLESVEWLEAFLAAYDGAIVIVSHDRDFLDATCNRIVELDRQTATEYVGNYASFVEQRALRIEQQRAAARNQQRKIAQDEEFIARFRYKAKKAGQVQSRIKRLERTERIDAPAGRRKSVSFRFPEPPRCGREVVTLDGVVKRYGDNVVYDGLDLVLERGHKIALVGPNGAGKSTLLKLIAGAVRPDDGAVRYGHNVRLAYYAQHALDQLDAGKTALQEVAATLDTSRVNPRSVLGAFLFSGEDADKRVGVLSGGEKARLALAKLLANPANLLCMDEPTNHLDVASRDVVEDALADYAGTVVLITHDRHLIRSVADMVIEVRDGRAHVHLGDYEAYLDRVAGSSPDVDGPAPAPSPEARDGQERRKRDEAERRNQVYQATKDLRRKVERVEKQLAEAEAEVAELNRTLADPDVYADAERVKELVARHNAAKDRSAALMEEWERLETALDHASTEAGAGPVR
jgi:ATP-binding cassette, subfamily F, member 3